MILLPPTTLDISTQRWNRMPKVATTVISTIAAPRKAFYAWLVPGVFY